MHTLGRDPGTGAIERARERPRLRWLLLWLVLATQLPALLLFATAGWLVFDRAQVAMAEQLMRSTVALSHRVNARVVGVQRSLQQLAQQLPPEGESLHDFHRAAAALARDLEVDSVLLVRANGQPLIDTLHAAGAALPRTVPAAFGDVARTARSDVVDVTTWPERNKPVVGIGVPLTRAGGETLALHAVIDLTHLQSLLDDPQLLEHWQAAVVDDAGRYVARAGDSTATPGARIGPRLREQLAQDDFATVRLAEPDAAPAMVSYWTSPATHWTGVVQVPVGIFNESAWRAVLRLGMPLALVIALGVLGARLMYQRLATAVGELHAAARAADDSRRQGEQRLEGMLQAAPSATVLIDSNHRVRTMNPAARALFGHTPQQLLGRSVEPLFTPLSWRDCQEAIAEALRGQLRGPDGHIRGHCVRLGGDVFPAEFSVNAIPGDGADRLIAVTVHDISEREALQAATLAAHQELEQTALRFERMLLREMDNRQAQIGRELHDAVGSAMAGISLLLEAAAARRREPELVGALLEKAHEQVGLVSERLRQLSRGIVPAGSEPGALRQALEQYVLDAASIMGIECTLRARGDFSDVGAENAGHVYRIVQEAITNAVRHGQARSVSVRLARAGAHCSLSVRDDGKGCDLSLVHPTHPGMGLKSMQARARALQGQFSLHNRRSGGCEVLLRWSEPAGIDVSQEREAAQGLS